MAVTKFRNVTESDRAKTIWRYLTFSKFISLFTYRALWFSKLNTLIDEYEGAMPSRTDAAMASDTGRRVPPELRAHLAGSNQRNVEDGRELTAVNCWFLSEVESEKMWNEYAPGPEGVAIKSTISALSQSVFCEPQVSCLGVVRYVDLDTHEMSFHEANQAFERAFLKRLAFAHEHEVRIVTMNFRGPMCVNMDGTIPTPAEYEGARMNNFENPGLYVRVDLRELIHAIVLSPGSAAWFESLVKRIVSVSGVESPVFRSALSSS
jgi:hypothetical protein